MCQPNAVVMAAQVVLSATTAIISNIEENKKEQDNRNYRQLVALNNIKNSTNQARLLEQKGIEEARNEKIAGLKEANKLSSINSASGFDLNSSTNMLNYDDIIQTSNTNASLIKQNYSTQADSYINKANSYLSEFQEKENTYNQSQYSNALNALNSNFKVAQKWYSNQGGSQNGGFKSSNI